MSNTYFKFKQFTINQDKTAMKVGVDGVLLGAWVDADGVQNILDIGTGTGLLALMLAQKSLASIIALEIDEDAFMQATENVTKSSWTDRIELKKLALQEFMKTKNKGFDLIVCNPPYFSQSVNSDDNQRNLARHDDTLSADELFTSVIALLSENGRFCMIYPFSKKKMLFELAQKNKIFPQKLLIVRGNEKKKPNRLLVEFSFFRNKMKENELIIRDSKSNEYTKKYKELTKEYYLNF